MDDGPRIAREGLGNLVVLGHIVSGSISIMPYIRELRERGLEVVCMSGVLDVGAGGPGEK